MSEFEKTKKWLSDLGYKPTDSFNKVLSEKAYLFHAGNDELVFMMARKLVVLSFTSSKTILEIGVNNA